MGECALELEDAWVVASPFLQYIREEGHTICDH
jgi:hypothetical protein